MLDRTIAPPAGSIVYSEFPEVENVVLKNGLPLSFLNAGTQPVLKLELTFDSGSKYEKQRSVSWLSAKMLMEGTSTMSAGQIAASFDALGAHLDITPGFDQITIGVFCLQRNFEQVLALLSKVLTDAQFPAKEFDLLKSNRADQIRMNDKKSNLLASKKIREAFFGEDHFYGLGLTPEMIMSVPREGVVDFYQSQMFANPCIYISGTVTDHEIGLLEQYLTFDKGANRELLLKGRHQQQEMIIERPEALQSSIRIAWQIPSKSDQDYFDYQIANSILGGYFGSRLMKNIREEKGYTYGISTYPVHLEEASFGILSADVVAEKTSDAISEIWNEIDKLKQFEVDQEELQTVTNYMAGSFMNSINTPFQLMEKFKSIHKIGLDYNYYRRFFDRLKSITPDEIQSAVSNVFSHDSSSLVVVGRVSSMSLS